MKSSVPPSLFGDIDPLRTHSMPFGAEVQSDNSVRFRLWAPSHPKVELQLEESSPQALCSLGNGWHEIITKRAGSGTLYRFVLPGGLLVPDPASRYQPHDVHGPSEVVNPAAFRWSDLRWRGRPWHEAVIYELHVGAFTPEGPVRGG